MTTDRIPPTPTSGPTRSHGPSAAGSLGHLRLPGEVLVATDGLPAADAAVALAAMLARRDHVPLRVAAVVEESTSRVIARLRTIFPNHVERWRADRLYMRIRAQLQRILGDMHAETEVTFGYPASNIAHTAAGDGAALITIGLGAQTPIARLFGDETALGVIRAAGCPVLAVVGRQTTLPSRALVAVDFTPASVAAARTTLQVVADGAVVHVCHVEAAPGPSPSAETAEWRKVYERGASAMLDELVQLLVPPTSLTVVPAVLQGDPAPTLLDFASTHGVDLLATGTRRLGPHARSTEGSVAARLLHAASCSVLVAPAPRSGEPHDTFDIAARRVW